MTNSSGVIRNCLPATRVAILKTRFLGFIRTHKPQTTLSRRMRPSVAVERRGRDSLISTIGSSFPQAKRGQKIEKVGHFWSALSLSQAGSALRSSGNSTTPTLGSVVQRGLIPKEIS